MNYKKQVSRRLALEKLKSSCAADMSKSTQGSSPRCRLCTFFLSPSSHPALQQHRPLSQGQGQGQDCLGGGTRNSASSLLLGERVAPPLQYIYISQHISRCSKRSLPALMEKAWPWGQGISLKHQHAQTYSVMTSAPSHVVRRERRGIYVANQFS